MGERCTNERNRKQHFISYAIPRSNLALGLILFIDGLKPEVRRDVIPQSPTSLVRAASLARSFDERYLLQSSVAR